MKQLFLLNYYTALTWIIGVPNLLLYVQEILKFNVKENAIY